MDAGGAENDVALQSVQIVLAQMELRAPGLQIQNLLIQLLPFSPIGAGHVDTVAQQQSHERPIADAQNDRTLSLQFLKILIQSCHFASPFAACALQTIAFIPVFPIFNEKSPFPPSPENQR